MITVPADSVVTMHGNDVTALLTPERINPYPLLFTNDQGAPMFETYTLNGLYLKPDDVQVVYNGTLLSCVKTEEGRISVFSADYPLAENHAVDSVVLAYTRAYFHYTSQGYHNTDNNLLNAIQYVKLSSELYKNLTRSKESYKFLTPVTSQMYNKLEISSVREIREGEYLVFVDFEISQKIYYVQRYYEGVVRLHVVMDGTTPLIAGMVIDSK